MLHWQQMRIPFLAVLLGALLLVLGKTITDPTIGQPTPYTFPKKVPLKNWQPLPDAPEATVTASADAPKRLYRFAQNGKVLEIEMRYLTDTNGNIPDLLKKDLTLPEQPNSRLFAGIPHRDETGFYGLFSHQGRAYLSACINPVGGSTLTRSQFRQNLQTYDLQPQRLRAWLVAKADLRDRRCLLTTLSLPIQQDSLKTTAEQLERVWVNWYQWWQPRFPSL